MTTQTEMQWQLYSPSSLLTLETENRYTELLVSHYESSLLSNPRAQAFLGNVLELNDKETVQTYRLGFSDRSLPTSLPELGSMEGEAIRGVYQRFGLFKSNCRETFRGMLFVPIFDENGDLAGAFGQRIADFPLRQRADTDFAVRPDVTGLFFQHEAMKTYKHVLLCESPFDVMSLYAKGINNAIAILDFKYFDDDHLSNLLEHDVASVTIAFSRTSAGDRYFAHVRRLLEGVDIKVDKLEGVVGESISTIWSKSKMMDRLIGQIDASQAHLANASQNLCSHSSKH